MRLENGKESKGMHVIKAGIDKINKSVRMNTRIE